MSAERQGSARGWVEHLQGGGTTPWSAWFDDNRSSNGAVPGAQQLELLRRLNAVSRPDPGLARRVLEASAPGRGTPDLELVGADAGSDFGPRPIDPSELKLEELIRVAAGLVAEDLVAQGTPDSDPPPLVGLKRRLAPAYRLVGDPWAAPLIREDLRRQGWVPGGRSAPVYLLASDTGTLVANAWISRCFGEGAPPWRAWLDPFARTGRIPPRADLARIAGRHQRVEVLFDASDLPRLLRHRAMPRPTVPDLRRPSADAAEAARRIGATLDLLVLPERRAELLTRTLLPRVRGSGGSALRLPEVMLEWARNRGDMMRGSIASRGVPVHGDDLGCLLSGSTDGVETPGDGGVLDLLLGLLLDPAAVDGRVAT